LYTEILIFGTQDVSYTDEEKDLLATIFGNRSAAYLAIDESEAAVEDCNQALIYKPNYVKVQ
jgi:hypothetical protein